MEPSTIIGSIFDAVPIFRSFWHWLMERHMEIELRGALSNIDNSRRDAGPVIRVDLGNNPQILLLGDLVLTNHRTDRRERVVECRLVLKKQRWLLWDKTIAEAVVYVVKAQSSPDNPLNNVVLEPMSAPTVIQVMAQGPIPKPVQNLPKKMKLMLEFRMVGPIRRIRHKLRYVRNIY